MNQTLKRWPFVVISYCAVTREIILFHIECSWVQECSLGFMSKHNRTISFDKKFLTKLIKGPKLWSLPFIQLLLCDIFQLLWRNASVSLSHAVISLEGCARILRCDWLLACDDDWGCLHSYRQRGNVTYIWYGTTVFPPAGKMKSVLKSPNT